jgi:hypothetical protein
VRTRAGVVAALVITALAVSALPTAATPRTSGHTGRAAYEASIDEAVTAIERFWRSEYPDLYATRYVRVPADRVIAAEPGVRIPRCQGAELSYRDAQGNAFYCYEGNFVVYDDVPITFLRVGYFRRGFFAGYESCDLATIQGEVAGL